MNAPTEEIVKQKTFIAPNPDGSARGELLPVDPSDPDDLREAQEALFDDDEILDYIDRLADYVQNAKQREKLVKRKKTIKLRNYIFGNYLGVVDEFGKWIDKSDEGDGLYYDPETATYIDVLVASITKSRPTIKIIARAKEKIDKREAAAAAQIIFDDARDRLSPAKKIQREVKLHFLSAGEAYRYTYFNPNKPNCGIEEPVFEPKQLTKVETHWFCPACRERGVNSPQDEQSQAGLEPSENQPIEQEIGAIPVNPQAPQQTNDVCPKCSQGKLLSYTRKSAKIQLKKGTQYKNIGDVESEFVDPLQMTVLGSDMDSIGDALAVQRDRMLERCILEDAFNVENLKSTGTPYHLKYLEQQTDIRTSGAFAEVSTEENEFNGREFERLHFQETWLAPVALRFKFKKDTVLKNGKVVRAGMRLKDLFPQGMYFARCGQRRLNLYGQAISNCWSHAVNAIGEDFHGVGEWDLAAIQDQLNEVSSMKMNQLLFDSTTPLIYRSDAVQGGQIRNKFGAQVPVEPTYPKDKSLDDIAKRIEGSRGIPEAYTLAEDLRQRMLNRTGAMTSTGAGMPDIQAVAKTATAYRLWYEHTLGRRGPMLALRAEMEVEQAYQILEMKQAFLCRAALEYVEKECGSEALEWFMKCNIRRDLQIEAVPGSWMPQTESQLKGEFQEFLGILAPIVAAKPELIDRIIAKASELYTAFDVSEHQADTTEAQLRLEKLLKVAEFVESEAEKQGIPTIIMTTTDNVNFNYAPVPPLVEMVMRQTAKGLKIIHVADPSQPPTGFENYPLDLMLDDHKELEKVYIDYLKTAEGRRRSAFTRACLNYIAVAHKKALFAFEREMQRYALAAQEPALEAELIANDAMHDQQLAQNEQLHEQGIRHQGEADVQSMALGAIGQQVAPEENASSSE